MSRVGKYENNSKVLLKSLKNSYSVPFKISKCYIISGQIKMLLGKVVQFFNLF